jgi:Tfp pilus assembly protein PilN
VGARGVSGRWNFARRPFRDERPVFAAIGLALALGLGLLVANFAQYRKFSREVGGTRAQIAWLEQRSARAAGAAAAARSALDGYKLSSLAQESAGLQRIVRERRFSWLALLARLERALPSDVRLARLAPRFESADAVSVDLAILGRSADSVVRTLTALARDPAFQAIQLHSEAKPDQGSPEGYSFLIDLKYVPEETR